MIELNEKRLSDRLFDYVSEKDDISSSTYVAGTIRAVKSWRNFIGKPLRRHIKVHMAGSARPTVENEKIPTQEELKKIILATSVRDRICDHSYGAFGRHTAGNELIHGRQRSQTQGLARTQN